MEIHAAALNFRDVLIALGMLREHYASHLRIERAEDIRLGFDCRARRMGRALAKPIPAHSPRISYRLRLQ